MGAGGAGHRSGRLPRFFAGLAQHDPFFCDVEGAKNNFHFTSDDFFADKDVCSIVLEVPNSALGAKEVRLWARTLTPAEGGGWTQVERGARPAQAVILVEERDAYLRGEPADDARFLAGFAHALEHIGRYSRRRRRRAREAGTFAPRCNQCHLMTLQKRPARHFPITQPGTHRRLRSIGSCAFSQTERSRGIA